MSFHSSTIPAFNPPGNLDELNPANRSKWSSDNISVWMTGEISADPRVVSRGRTPLEQFFNGTITPFDTSQTPTPVTWNAFPLLVTTRFRTNAARWKKADETRQVQDEYLEWSVFRDSTSQDILSVTFTCEGPEYWQFFAENQRDDFLKKIREINADFASQMQDSDFFDAQGKYVPENKWNNSTTTGSIAHLIQPANTLGAEIDIAGQATVIRKDSEGNIVTDQDQLIRCSKYGNPGRHSDPTIGGAINGLAQSKKSVTVADPVALYIHKVDTTKLVFDTANTSGTPDDDDLTPIDNPSQVFLIQRGDLSKRQGLRMQVKVPAGIKGKSGQQLNVSNIYDKSTKQHIRLGGQIADHVSMGVSAVTFGVAQVAAPISCYEPSAHVRKFKASLAMESIKATEIAATQIGRGYHHEDE